MARHEQSRSPRPEEVSKHYASGYEGTRLESAVGNIERERTKELLKRFLPPVPATIADVGGGTGVYACWLAQQGYSVHLIDIVPVHIELAKQESARQPENPLASAEVGDACSLSWNDDSLDAALLLGPLYHLTDRKDRLRALSECYRVLKTGGMLLAAGISRFVSTFDGLRGGFLKDPTFVGIVQGDLENGQHRNPTGDPNYFMDAFFHHPEELRGEVAQAGFEVENVYGVEGPAWLTPEIDDWWTCEDHRETLLKIARRLENEPTLLGVSAHLVAVGKKA